MTDSTLKTKATKGMLWSAVDKFAAKAGQFIIGVILARLLMPEDFGLIGMLSIFIAISQIFIDSGMGSGLIQKKSRTNTDFSTVFIFNFAISCLFYLTLFFSAQPIARFYDMPQLVILTRVLAINIIINSLAIVQRSRLTINIDFKTIAKVNVTSVFAGGIIAIFLAYQGWGVWALVIQRIVYSLTSTLMLWFLNRWRFTIQFSKKSFNRLFSYGSKLLIAGLYAQTMHEVYNIVIGKAYSASELGYYTRAKSFAEMTAGTVSGILHQVTFPILASLQDDKDRMVSVYSRLIKMAAFFVIPAMTLLSLMSEPLIRLLLTDKWISVVVLLQWMSFARIFHPISVINMNILNAVGRSDLFLKVDLSKFPITVLALIITIPLGVKAIVIGHVVTSFIAFFINAYIPGKMFGYGGLKQLKDLLPVVFATGIMALLVAGLNRLIDDLLAKLIIGSLAGLTVYLIVCYFFKLEELNELKAILNKVKPKITYDRKHKN
ncbi:Membrane protein involved in the export of O-antigen and teichoic acid [Mariniphaga anaerophila]|uniref:Membrane protein involved in the export of O-antigen and teichoic acid n=1 Tax=Mariniphaga anaerophila TaxID=1484053 RepID=A0A1M5BMK5_9BACT|nr:lipopolysaccharide biosynthesis protein [Mariniphaga anaerophila]SHF43447.1 Membrane protein involved in the export of O-antigen and teichoic acid [Mariniphaga anaerophila]